MPNIGSVLKEEISRLARRELRGQVAGMKKASAQYRRHIAALRRQVAKLESQVSLLRGKVLDHAAPAAEDAGARRVRFAPKALRSQRERLGLSAADYGRLLGVSAQSVYNWEHRIGPPAWRADQAARCLARRWAREKPAPASSNSTSKAPGRAPGKLRKS